MPIAASRRILPVPTDQTSHLIAVEAAPKPSAIENELPTYRAISNRAVFSVLCGALAALSFADLKFLVFAVLAILLGFMANVAIKRHPDILTGRRLANTGIAMGLIFGLTVITYTAVNDYILAREAGKFANLYAKVLKEGSWGDALLWRVDAETRKTKTAAEAEQDYEKMRSRERGMPDQKFGGLQNLRKALVPKDAHLHFIRIENQGEDDNRVGQIGYFATALYEVEAPAAKGESGSNPFALAILKGAVKGRHYEWHVEDVVFPYHPRTYRAAAKPVDDGHGHAGSAH
jgi:hypothetical protein